MELGQILYEGPSQLDDNPIVALASYNTTNRKTGPMVQVWILRSDIEPLEATKQGADESVCGNCPSRHHLGGDCYVSLARGPNQVWRAYKAGRYMKATTESLAIFSGKAVRLGAYGDPAAVPYEALAPIVRRAAMTTGYTHQIGHANFDRRHLNHCMVSTDSVMATQAHNRHGRRTFRVKTAEEPLLAGEILCPATVKDFVQCTTCGLCSGAHGKGRSIAVDAHGAMASRRYRRIPALEIVNG